MHVDSCYPAPHLDDLGSSAAIGLGFVSIETGWLKAIPIVAYGQRPKYSSWHFLDTFGWVEPSSQRPSDWDLSRSGLVG